jgi:hypothetical protein
MVQSSELCLSANELCVPWGTQTVTNKVRGILIGSEVPGILLTPMLNAITVVR